MLSADDSLERLISPQVILPAQLSWRGGFGARESSAHRLMLGILKDAVDLYCKVRDPRHPVPARRLREVHEWFESHDRTWLFSFERICEALEFDPECMRRGVRRARAAAAQSPMNG